MRILKVLCEFRITPCVVRNFRTTQSSWLTKAISSSFQLQIIHGLKRWILDFLSFEMVYGMQKMDFGKCSKSAKEDCSYCPLCFSSLCFPLLHCSFLTYFERLWQRAMELQSLVLHEFELPKLCHELYTALPHSWIALVIKKISKHQNLTQFDQN